MKKSYWLQIIYPIIIVCMLFDINVLSNIHLFILVTILDIVYSMIFISLLLLVEYFVRKKSHAQSFKLPRLELLRIILVSVSGGSLAALLYKLLYEGTHHFYIDAESVIIMSLFVISIILLVILFSSKKYKIVSYKN
ncbi:MAG: hypothetical protein WC140_00360 [Bacteroidales bacterium]